MVEPSTVPAEKPEKHDTVMSVSAEELDSKNFFLGMADKPMENEIEVTPVDKAKFVDAVLTNSRFKANYSFFGGKFTFTLKNRTYEEARAAMLAATKDGIFGENRTLFVLRLRLMLMCMQVDMLNGTAYPDAETLGSLVPVFEDGKTVPPKWMDRVKIFSELPEAVFEAMWQCVHEFETKYWTLVRHSRDQDFWRPE